MIGTVGALVASAVIGGGVSLLGAHMQASSADKAAQAQVASNAAAIDAQKDISAQQIKFAEETRDQQREDQKPWREAGAAALTKLQEGIASGAFTMKDWEFKADPGYQFRLDQGQKALERGASANGNLFSGTLGKALTEYGQDFASNEFDRAYARASGERLQQYNMLAGVAGTGQQATNAMSSASAQAGQSVGNALSQLGNTQTTALINQGNALAQGHNTAGQAWANGASNVGAAANTGIENYLLWQHLG